ncbi:hypothetical protein KY289_028717 [Solanum tuberosum]|uniref:Uncharacterized protein n=1 Tax=Solanum tuberosum TaxID=4113 RepID=M1BSF6_SOLTU|nr:hypothetical protein KY289_028717 [Solanum tuberosum]
MKPIIILFHILLVLSRIETNEATRILDDTHLLLPSLQTRPPIKTPTPNPGTETSVNMASTVTERNFVGCNQVFAPPLLSTNAYHLHEPLLLSSLQTRTPVTTPSPNPGTSNSVNMANKVTKRNFVGHKEVFAPPPPSTNTYHIHEPLLLPSLQTRAPVMTPSPDPGTGK